jgi:peroxin-10
MAAHGEASVDFGSAPYLYLAAVKDREYTRLLSSALQDAIAASPVGGRTAIKLTAECDLLSRFIYYYSSYCLQDRTIGQEYCDLLPVHLESERSPRLLDNKRRLLLVLAHSLIPYVGDCWQQGFSTRLFSATRLLSVPQLSEGGGGGVGRRRLRNPPTRLSSLLTNLTHNVTRRVEGFSGVARWLRRFFLMVFYFNSQYYEFVMRLLSVRLVRPSRAPQTSSRYFTLGALLALELVGGGAASAVRHVSSVLSALRRSRSRLVIEGEDIEVEGNAATDYAPQDLDQDRGGVEDSTSAIEATEGRVVCDQQLPTGNKEEEGDSRDGVAQKGRCVLCIGPLTNTAATECGHLFCWECVIGWCQAASHGSGSAECPLCRQRIEPQRVLLLPWH